MSLCGRWKPCPSHRRRRSQRAPTARAAAICCVRPQGDSDDTLRPRIWSPGRLDPGAPRGDGVPLRGHPRRRGRRHLGRAHEALAEANRIEAAWTVFRDTSALSRPQSARRRRAGRRRCRALRAARAMPRAASRHVEGAFDITSTPLSRCWGFLRARGPPAVRRRRSRGPGAASAWTRSTLDAEAPNGALHAARHVAEPGRASARATPSAPSPRDCAARGVRHALVSAGAQQRRGASADAARGWAVDVRSRSRSPRRALARVAAARRRAGDERRRRAVHRGRRPTLRPRDRPAHRLAGGAACCSVTVITGDAADGRRAVHRLLRRRRRRSPRRYCERIRTLVAAHPEITTDERSAHAASDRRLRGAHGRARGKETP